jgi:hypothetical protein
MIIGDEDVQAPCTLRFGLQMVEEQAVTVGYQFPTKALTTGIDCQTVGAPCLRLCPPVGMRRGGWRGTVLRPWEMDGSEISEQDGG